MISSFNDYKILGIGIRFLNPKIRFFFCSDYGNTNNGTEKKNCTIKDTVTIRKRLTVRQLFKKLVTAIEVYSESPDCENEDIKITENDYRKAYEYKKLQPQIKVYANGSEYFILSSKLPDGFEEAVKARRELQFDDWGHYLKVVDTCYFVRKSTVFQNILFCSCCIGAKKQVCKHFLVLACKLKYFQFPEQITSILIEGPRTRGRPKIAKRGKAL
uniref:SWIM-type domain-containing protein n=1 Tax=Panagrolaimus davidi TaxID=227884 RepID=A0A914PVJ3_9BILA